MVKLASTLSRLSKGCSSKIYYVCVTVFNLFVLNKFYEIFLMSPKRRVNLHPKGRITRTPLNTFTASSASTLPGLKNLSLWAGLCNSLSSRPKCKILIYQRFWLTSRSTSFPK